MAGPAHIRDATVDDRELIEQIAVDAGLFPSDEVGLLGEMLASSCRGESPDARWLVLEDAEAIGAAYYAPEPFADRMWNLYFIAVAPAKQSSGAWTRLMRHIEQALRAEEARVRQFYGPEDHKVVFWKSLVG